MSTDLGTVLANFSTQPTNTSTMKKALFLCLTAFLFASISFAQQDSIKKYPLKDYIAPDIRYRVLNLGSQLAVSGLDKMETVYSSNGFSANADLHYYEYENLTNYQGTTRASLSTSYGARWSKSDTVKDTYSIPRISLRSLSQSRFYNQNTTFWGIHGDIRYSFSGLSSKDNEGILKTQLQFFTITPYISFGKGRIEPIESVRKAMDILLALQKYNRLGMKPDKTMIDSLARVANGVSWKRFYDFRFKRIYQLEELDKAIQNMGLVDTADIIYFANLNDIWSYTKTYRRGSGLRYEGGIIPSLSIINDEYDDSDQSQNNRKFNDKQYGIYGFFSLRRMKPTSYAWQSDIMIDLTFGYERSIGKEEETGNNNEWDDSYLKALLNTGWQFGFYPNTRTYAGITPYAAVSFVGDQETKENTFGASTGFWFDAYYYVSPRFRITFDAGFYYTENFDYTVPSLFWDNFNSYRIDKNHYLSNKGFGYRFNFRLSYAIL